jgi:hypothetical protein
MLSAALVTHGGTPPTPITTFQVITIPGRYVLANGQFARAAFELFLAGNNVIQGCTLSGVFIDKILEDDQSGSPPASSPIR